MLSRVVTRSDEWRPSLLQCGFPALDGVDSSSASILVHVGPHAWFLGLPVTGAAWEAPNRIMPCKSFWAATFQLLPLLSLHRSSGTQVATPCAASAVREHSELREQLAGLDADWKRRMAHGRLHMVWQVG